MQITLNQHSEMQSSISNRVDRDEVEKSLTQHCRETRGRKQSKCAAAFFAVADALQVYRTPEQQKARTPSPVWL